MKFRSTRFVADRAARDNFEQLEQLLTLLAPDGTRVRFGTGSVNFTAGIQSSAVTTVSHGLGKAPLAVGAFGVAALAPASWTFHTQSWTKTSFGVWARQDSAPGTGSVAFAWVAFA